MKRGRPKKSWDEMVKEDMKIEEERLVQCASMIPKTETSGDDVQKSSRLWLPEKKFHGELGLRYSFICQGTSTRRQ